MNPKKIKIHWGYSCNSIEKIWENSDNPDYHIYIDNTRDISRSQNNILILYEPKSIIPNNYEKAISGQSNYHKIFTHSIEISDGKKIINMPPFFPSWISEDLSKVYEKSKLVSMIASDKVMCSGHVYRQKIANEFPFRENLFGRGRNYIENKIDGLKDYMFSVAMENEISDIYYTEKILDCFLTGTIPVYWGTKKIDKIFNKEGILFLEDIRIEDLTHELYFKKINYVRENFIIAKNLKSTSNHMIDFVIKNI